MRINQITVESKTESGITLVQHIHQVIPNDRSAANRQFVRGLDYIPQSLLSSALDTRRQSCLGSR